MQVGEPVSKVPQKEVQDLSLDKVQWTNLEIRRAKCHYVH